MIELNTVFFFFNIKYVLTLCHEFIGVHINLIFLIPKTSKSKTFHSLPSIKQLYRSMLSFVCFKVHKIETIKTKK